MVMPPVYHPFFLVTQKNEREVVFSPLVLKDEQYYISQIEKLIEISGVTGEYVKPMELYAILSVKYTEIEQDEYERIILLFEKFRFGGKTLRDYELYVLECFKNKFIKLLYKKSKIHKKIILRYKYLL